MNDAELLKMYEGHSKLSLIKALGLFQAENDNLVKQVNELKPLCANRGAFIDWCNEHHQEIVDEYLEG